MVLTITARANQSLGFVKRNIKTRSSVIKTREYNKGISASTPGVLLQGGCYSAVGDGPEKR